MQSIKEPPKQYYNRKYLYVWKVWSKIQYHKLTCFINSSSQAMAGMSEEHIRQVRKISTKPNQIKGENTDLENCPRIAGMEPLYNPRAPISGSFEIISGKLSVDACTRVQEPLKFSQCLSGRPEKKQCYTRPTLQNIFSTCLKFLVIYICSSWFLSLSLPLQSSPTTNPNVIKFTWNSLIPPVSRDYRGIASDQHNLMSLIYSKFLHYYASSEKHKIYTYIGECLFLLIAKEKRERDEILRQINLAQNSGRSTSYIRKILHQYYVCLPSYNSTETIFFSLHENVLI